MKIARDTFYRGLQIASLIPARYHPARGFVLLATEGKRMRLSSFAHGMAIHVWCHLLDVDDKINALVSLATLTKWVEFQENTITLQQGKDHLVASSGNSRASFKVPDSLIGTTTAPLKPDIVISDTKLNIGTLLQSVCFAATKDEARPILTGTLFRIKDELILAASDGYRLSEARTPLNKRAGPISVIVPVRSWIKVLKKPVVGISDKWVVFRSDEDELEVQIEVLSIDGYYPDYERVIPQEFPLRVEVRADEFLQACLNVRFAAENSLLIIRIHDDHLELCTSSNEGNGRSWVPCKTEGDGEREIAVCLEWIIQGIKAALSFSLLPSPVLHLGFTTPFTPMVMQLATQHNKWRYIVMPRCKSREEPEEEE